MSVMGKGTPEYKNPLEMLLKSCRKAIQDKVDVNPKAGLKVGDNKMRYSEALDLLTALEHHFAVKGAFSFGICLTCTKFSSKGMYPEKPVTLGKCGSRVVSIFDCCEQHSKEGGGYGL